MRREQGGRGRAPACAPPATRLRTDPPLRLATARAGAAERGHWPEDCGAAKKIQSSCHTFVTALR